MVATTNTIAPMIVILGCLKVDIEISDVGVGTTESNGCREVSGNNRDTNRVLAVMQEGARFFYKDK